MFFLCLVIRVIFTLFVRTQWGCLTNVPLLANLLTAWKGIITKGPLQGFELNHDSSRHCPIMVLPMLLKYFWLAAKTQFSISFSCSKRLRSISFCRPSSWSSWKRTSDTKKETAATTRTKF